MAPGFTVHLAATATDAVLAAIKDELEFWRPFIDRGADQFDAIRIVVHLNPKVGRPRRIQVSPERNREVGVAT